MKKINNLLDLLFVLGFAFLPIAIFKGSLLSFADIKIAVFSFLAVVCSLSLLLRFYQQGYLKMHGYFLLFFFFALLRISFFGSVHNPGFLFQTLSLSLSACIVGIWILNSEIKREHLCWLVLPAILLSLAGGLYAAYFRKALISVYSPSGAPIGLKNSLSIYLAQCLPILLTFTLDFKSKTESKYKLLRIVTSVLTVLSLLLIFINRTRSAWWMVILILLYLVYRAVKDTDKWKRSLIYFSICIMVSGAVLLLAPNKMYWKSTTPYKDSFTTLASYNNSSGRDQLWKVAIEILKANPFVGIGTANYSVLWPSYISPAVADPKAFGLLRPDLPLLNDYLQVAVENGVFVALFFVFIAFLYPVFLLFKTGEFILLSSVLVSANAFFDSPFLRAENLILFIAIIAFSLRDRINIQSTNKIIYPLLLLVIVFSSLLSFELSAAVFYRRLYASTNAVAELEQAWNYWPYDIQWKTKEVVEVYNAGKKDLAQKIALKRSEYWPNDPESYLILASIADRNSDFAKAQAYYRRALKTVEGGRCYKPAFQIYMKSLLYYDLKPSKVMLKEIENCRLSF